MALLGTSNHKDRFFTPPERMSIVEAIRQAERLTSGEIRVYVESHCRYMEALDRAAEIFTGLKMDQTARRNGVLLYVALKDRQLAVYGDKGIHEKVGAGYWHQELSLMKQHFSQELYAEGIRQCILDIGKALQSYFPFDQATDKNELPDDIVFGK